MHYPIIYTPIKVSERLPEITINETIQWGGEIHYWKKASQTLNLLLDGVPCAGSYILENGQYKNCWAIEPFGMFFEKDFHRIEWLEIFLPLNRYVFTKEVLEKRDIENNQRGWDALQSLIDKKKSQQ